ncbi:hypothetical protein [Acidovorax sp. 106]|uniref:hypothetical protein n=1 Tax=Acidovorax sp. 106 TaxID=2135637 RepID=UPI000EB2282B|nr:hypothetical protein [Acidovorax sp. 106]RLJ38139.1 hypothetical protein C8C98_1858 [Acidovorax sp. 106]
MNHSEKLAIAAHLHVLLRRKTGRVTDTEWMASNGSYAREIVRFARERAVQDQAPELVEWADRLEHCMQDTLAAELRRSAREAVAAKTAEQAVVPAVHALAPSHPQTRRYVGGIR